MKIFDTSVINTVAAILVVETLERKMAEIKAIGKAILATA